MSSAVMTKRIARTSPRFKASGLRTQIAGVIYLLTVVAAAFAEIFIRGRLNIAGALMVVLAMIAVTLLFCDILNPLNRRLSLLAASFNLVGLAFEVLRLQPRGANIAVVFNGFFCILIGCFVFRSTSLPRIVGGLMVLGGLGWLTFLSLPVANYLSPYNLAFGLLGEGAVGLWILLMEVNAGRRIEQFSSAGRAPSIAAAGAPLSGADLIRPGIGFYFSRGGKRI
jgi:hypothetical protein